MSEHLAKTAISMAVVLGVLALAGIALRRDAEKARVITVCSGCGSEWESIGPSQPITKCPNCPISMEEFEALKEQVRNRKAREVSQ